MKEMNIASAQAFESMLSTIDWSQIQNSVQPQKDAYETVIGLEVHAQLRTLSKAFATEETTYGNMPNTNISVVTLAHPGALPTVNKEIFNYAIKMGIACHSTITKKTIFSRKNYYYPDLPKGYQITQDKTPICWGGEVIIKPKGYEEDKSIKITRIHIEEDAGKSMHIDGEEESFIDLNRAGVALIEIVSEPDMRNPEEAYAYLTEIRKLVRYLEVCDGNMEEGSLRCDVNISIRKKGAEAFGTRAEIKNLNSFSNVKRAIDFEVERQLFYIQNGWKMYQETRNFDASIGKTIGLRSKESMNDYRYFPEPDLTPINIDDKWINDIKDSMPPLPRELFLKFSKEYALSEYDAEVLTSEKGIALYFEEVCQTTKNYKSAANWVTGNVKSYLNELTLHIKDFPIKAQSLAELINLIDAGKINHNIASKQVYPIMLETKKDPSMIVKEEGMEVSNDTDEIKSIIEGVLSQFPDKVQAYKDGKKGLLGMFMGQIMKKTQGKADAQLVKSILSTILDA